MNSLFLRRAFHTFRQDLWRNKWVSLSTIGAIAMVFLLTWLIVAINASSERIIDRVEKKVDISAFFEQKAPDFQIEAFLRELENLQKESSIRSFTYFSKDQALEEMKQKFPEKVRFLERYQFENPLQASVEIVPNTWTPDELLTFLKQDRFFGLIDRQFFDRYGEKKEEVNKILKLLHFFRQSGLFLVAIFLLSGALLIGFFISALLQEKKKEIFIMRLVGADHWFIRLPFLLEGMTLALAGFLLSFAIFGGFLALATPHVIRFFSSSSDQIFMSGLMFEIEADFYSGFWWYALAVIVLSSLTAFVSVEKFLHKRHFLTAQ